LELHEAPEFDRCKMALEWIWVSNPLQSNPKRLLAKMSWRESPVIFLDWSQYGAPGWTEACPGVDLSDLIGGWSGSKVVELLELQTLYPIGREERTLYH